jgi:hypothetical protein
MKRLFYLIIAIFAFSFMANSVHAELHLGAKIGYNASKLSTNIDSIKSSMNSGFHVGGWLRIGNRLHIQPEVLYTMSGTTFENIWKQKVTVHSLDIPILLGFNLVQSDALKVRLNAGPKISFPVGTQLKDLTLTGPIEDVKVNSTNWSLQAGAGIDFLFLTLDVRYQAGLNDVISEVSGSSGTTTVEGKGSMFVVSAGIKIF